jgi:acetylornithine deacetylase/succinyl-diaminopimelate desuccinylase-like protein
LKTGSIQTTSLSKEKTIMFGHTISIWCLNLPYFLNSHHDTVRPNQAYTNDPFNAFVKDGKLFGLGSNDACCLFIVSQFCPFYAKENLPYNIVIVFAEEESR